MKGVKGKRSRGECGGGGGGDGGPPLSQQEDDPHRQLRAPAPAVMVPTSDEDLALRLDALE